MRAGTTVDQIAAQELGKDTPLPSLELGIDPNFMVGNCENGYSCVYMNTLAWRTPTTPLPGREQSARRLRTPVRRRRHRRGAARSNAEDPQHSRFGDSRRRRSCSRRLGPSDRTRVSDYFDSVREVERRIQKAEANSAELAAARRSNGRWASRTRSTSTSKLMFDLQWLAYQADITRVFTFMLGREVNSRTFPEIGISEPHHGLSHHRDDPRQLEKLAKINTYLTELFGSFLERLQSTPDGDGNLLDHSLILFGAGLSNPNTHSHLDLPLASSEEAGVESKAAGTSSTP